MAADEAARAWAQRLAASKWAERAEALAAIRLALETAAVSPEAVAPLVASACADAQWQVRVAAVEAAEQIVLGQPRSAWVRAVLLALLQVAGDVGSAGSADERARAALLAAHAHEAEGAWEALVDEDVLGRSAADADALVRAVAGLAQTARASDACARALSARMPALLVALGPILAPASSGAEDAELDGVGTRGAGARTGRAGEAEGDNDSSTGGAGGGWNRVASSSAGGSHARARTRAAREALRLAVSAAPPRAELPMARKPARVRWLELGALERARGRGGACAQWQLLLALQAALDALPPHSAGDGAGPPPDDANGIGAAAAVDAAAAAGAAPPAETAALRAALRSLADELSHALLDAPAAHALQGTTLSARLGELEFMCALPVECAPARLAALRPGARWAEAVRSDAARVRAIDAATWREDGAQMRTEDKEARALRAAHAARALRACARAAHAQMGAAAAAVRALQRLSGGAGAGATEAPARAQDGAEALALGTRARLLLGVASAPMLALAALRWGRAHADGADGARAEPLPDAGWGGGAAGGEEGTGGGLRAFAHAREALLCALLLGQPAAGSANGASPTAARAPCAAAEALVLACAAPALARCQGALEAAEGGSGARGAASGAARPNAWEISRWVYALSALVTSVEDPAAATALAATPVPRADDSGMRVPPAAREAAALGAVGEGGGGGGGGGALVLPPGLGGDAARSRARAAEPPSRALRMLAQHAQQQHLPARAHAVCALAHALRSVAAPVLLWDLELCSHALAQALTVRAGHVLEHGLSALPALARAAARAPDERAAAALHARLLDTCLRELQMAAPREHVRGAWLQHAPELLGALGGGVLCARAKETLTTALASAADAADALGRASRFGSRQEQAQRARELSGGLEMAAVVARGAWPRARAHAAGAIGLALRAYAVFASLDDCVPPPLRERVEGALARLLRVLWLCDEVGTHAAVERWLQAAAAYRPDTAAAADGDGGEPGAAADAEGSVAEAQRRRQARRLVKRTVRRVHRAVVAVWERALAAEAEEVTALGPLGAPALSAIAVRAGTTTGSAGERGG